MRNCGIVFACALWLCTPPALAADAGNRLVRLDAPADPYGVGLSAPKLSTPQWVGEDGVQAVIVLAIDDMSDAARYEAFLRPILDRLKQIDGRAPVSIMTKSIPADLPQLQSWLGEGLSIEPHTATHPCPCLQGGRLADAKATYDRCVDQLAEIPNSRSVAFRMPCCDSMNSVSPRFLLEIFHQTTPAGRFLTMDSSVFMLFTPDDPALPRALVNDEDGRDKFQKYVPVDRRWVNYVENYPYPYVIGRGCWEVPCLVPSDWEAQNRNGKCSPATVRDWRAALDAVVLKQGAVALCFHPHGWIENSQLVEWIDYAVSQHGRKIKFLTFPEVQRRLDANVLGGQPLRAADGGDHGVRVLDVDNDGYQDVVIGNQNVRQTRLWSPATGRWSTLAFPCQLVEAGANSPAGAAARFGVLQRSGQASVLVRSEAQSGLWHFAGKDWVPDPDGLTGLDAAGPVFTVRGGRDEGVRLRDLDGDGIDELLVANPRQQAIFARGEKGWQRSPLALPAGLTIVDAAGRDAGLRFVDFDADGCDDVVFSDARRYAAYVFAPPAGGWSRRLFDGARGRGDPRELPMIVRQDGSDNGSWFSYRHMWVQNEDTGGALPQHVDAKCFTTDFLGTEQEPPPRSAN